MLIDNQIDFSYNLGPDLKIDIEQLILEGTAMKNKKEFEQLKQ